MSTNPEKITIVGPADETTLENVETWWYEEGDLLVEYVDGETRRFPNCCVID